MENAFSKPRYHFFDTIRGIVIILMIFYHGMFDLYLFLGMDRSIMFSLPMNILQFVICSVFITISGACTQLSKNNLKRGIITLIVALLVTLSSFAFNEQYFVVFGILHFLGTASIIFHFLPKFNPNPFICLVGFVLFDYLLSNRIEIPHLWVFGITDSNFSSSDYFGLLPWIFLFYFGVWFGKVFLQKKLPNFIYNFKISVLSKIGTKSLIIYAVHQPVLLALVVIYQKFLN